tara:strand:- start:271 stop:756 length:486 start_codon:yes stop_codon:yes gene_type:complete
MELIKLDKKEVRKINEVVGSTFLVIQAFEYSLKYYLWLLANLDIIDFSKEEATKIIENHKKKTMGGVVTILKKHANIDNSSAALITEALDIRNHFIHSYFSNDPSLLFSVEGRILVRENVSKMKLKILEANMQVDLLMEPYALKFSEEELEEIRRSLIEKS